MKAEEAGRLRSVVLLHTLPDQSSHLDWMFEYPRESERLITFRCPTGTNLALAGKFQVERLADHRRAYLEYEGPVSGGRGEVRALVRFEIQPLEIADESIRLIVRSRAEAGVLWTGRKKGGPNPENGQDGVVWEFIGAVC